MTPEQIAAAMPQIEAHVALGLLAFPAKQVAGQKIPRTGWQSKVWDLGMFAVELRSSPYYGLTQPKDNPRRLIILDLDDGKAGVQPGQTRWQDRWKAIEGIPKTKVTSTPSGGAHAWFIWPDDATLPGGTWNGFTVRSLHGAKNWVAGPGSVKPDGKAYQDLYPDRPIAMMPVELARSGQPAKKLVNGHADELPERLTTHIDIVRFAGKLRFAGSTAAEIERTLLARLADGRIFATDPTWPWKPEDLAAIAADYGNKPQDGRPDQIAITGTAAAGPVAGTGGTVPPEHLSRQSRAAWYFAKMAGDRVRFDHGRGRWLVWAGHRWRPDEDGSVSRLWLNVLAKRYAEALKATDDATRIRMTEAVRTAGATNAAIGAGLDIASSMEPIATKADAWDPDPWALGCSNGVVDLRTGRLRPGRPEDMISRSTGVVYDPDAPCPRWDRFLAEVFAGDRELVDWYGLLIGTSLVGVMQELLALHHGLGNNGKSVAVRAERHAFGEYAVTIPIETLVSAKRSAGEATPDLMALRGARLAFTAEPDQTAKLRGGVLKRLASIDRMTGRPLYGMTQNWDPSHTVHLSTNHLPEVDDATDGFWRRVALVPWPVHFRKVGEVGDGPEEDPGLYETLMGEAPGILAWAVRGAMACAAGRSLHPFPTAVRVRTEEYRKAEDRIGGFIAEHVDYGPDATVLSSALFAAYKAWCDVEGLDRLDRLGPKKFPAEFLERGHVGRAEDGKKRVIFRGARLRLSTVPGNPGNLTPFADFSESTPHVEVPAIGFDSPDSPEDGARQPPVDLHAEALRIFGDNLAGAGS